MPRIGLTEARLNNNLGEHSTRWTRQRDANIPPASWRGVPMTKAKLTLLATLAVGVRAAAQQPPHENTVLVP